QAEPLARLGKAAGFGNDDDRPNDLGRNVDVKMPLVHQPPKSNAKATVTNPRAGYLIPSISDSQHQNSHSTIPQPSDVLRPDRRSIRRAGLPAWRSPPTARCPRAGSRVPPRLSRVITSTRLLAFGDRRASARDGGL